MEPQNNQHADAQASVSHLLVRQPQLESAQSGGQTMIDYFIGAALKKLAVSWREYVLIVWGLGLPVEPRITPTKKLTVC
jgi:hypothetical protein